ncbi:MAG: DUF2400 family protein [Vicinamibacterales bacterium]
MRSGSCAGCTRPADQEIVAFCAAGLAFGRVSSVMQSIDRLAAVMGPEPSAFVRRFVPARDGVALRDFVHRWIRGVDVIALLWILHQMLEQSGSIEGFFLEGDTGGDDVRDALDSFSRRAMALDLRTASRPCAGAARRRLFLSASVERQRL